MGLVPTLEFLAKFLGFDLQNFCRVFIDAELMGEISR
jgi:hypothetical protein